MKGHEKVVKILFQAGADPNIQDWVSNLVVTYSLTLLICTYACYVCITCVFFDYIQRGQKALFEAYRYGHDEVVKILLQAGADPNVQGKVSNLKYMVTHSLLVTVTHCWTLYIVHICYVCMYTYISFLTPYRMDGRLFILHVGMVMMK